MTLTNRNIVDLNHLRQKEKQGAVLERLYREHGAALRSFLLSRVSNEAEIEDIAQEVFIRLARMDDLQERLPSGCERNRAYIFQIANNILIDLSRRKAVRREYRDHHGARESEKQFDQAPEIILADREELMAVKKAILTMKPEWRRAFMLNRFKGWSHKAISQEMGVSVKQVEHYIANAIVRLRKVSLRVGGNPPGERR